MKVIYHNLPSKKISCIATIGAFDGIHSGHKFILKKLKAEALASNLPSLVITFDIPPSALLDKNFYGIITDCEDKKDIFESQGIDYVWFLKSSLSFLRLPARDFINYIFTYFRIKKFIVGYDFHFGYRGRGTIRDLTALSDTFGYTVSVVRKKRKGGSIISSSLVRKLIHQGDFKKVNFFLERTFHLKGRVIRGSGLGKKIGFPTANIFPHNYVVPAPGVYTAKVIVGSKMYRACVYIGRRPTIRENGYGHRFLRRRIEVHIIHFNKNILGKTITIHFLRRLRDEKKFSSLSALSKAIHRDVQLSCSPR